MINYQIELDKIIDSLEERPTLLLHGCCAPCSSYVLEYLSKFFDITLYFYNPNISDYNEYSKRRDEAERLVSQMPGGVRFMETGWDEQAFEKMALGLENAPEGGERCLKCYELRLRKAAEAARDGGFDYFTTTLTISPLKSSERLNEIGERLGDEYGVRHLPSDFKKREGYKRSIELSRQYGLYRQDYCGCRYSMKKP